MWAVSSGEERFVDTEEAASSTLAPPTILSVTADSHAQKQRFVSVLATLPSQNRRVTMKKTALSSGKTGIAIPVAGHSRHAEEWLLDGELEGFPPRMGEKGGGRTSR